MTKNNIRTLHIVNSYGGTAVFKNMFQKLDEISIQQTVYVPLNKNNRYRRGSHKLDFNVSGSQIIYDTSLGYIHKFFYGRKIATIANNIKRALGNDLQDYDVIHAGSLCSDGGVAYELWKKYKIPYIVSVRGTDVNFYYEKLFYKRNYFHKILLHSSFVVFISPSLKDGFIKKISIKIYDAIKDKIRTIPNGVDEVFSEKITPPTNIGNPVSILYCGGIQMNKNIHSTIKAINLLRENGLDIEYTIIGKGLLHRRTTPQYTQQIDALCEANHWITIRDSMDKEELRREMSNHDIFLMPSFSETFGLVYVEALSQGLPIIYSKGQGFDNFFNEGYVGYSVDAYSVDDIVNKIKLIMNDYLKICNNLRRLNFEQFSWTYIAEQYKKLYSSSMKN